VGIRFSSLKPAVMDRRYKNEDNCWMALTTHWEWRGFGSVSEEFRERFQELESMWDEDTLQRFTDEYLWIPDVDVNLKFRLGTPTQDGLKFKRFHERRGELEKWTESRAEIFPFPLDARPWRLLQEEMRARFETPATSDREQAVRVLKSVDPRIRTITVVKERQSRTWGDECNVKVELAQILSPQPMTSVGLEVWDPAGRLADRDAIELLEGAIEDLGVRDEKIEVMNYLDFIRRCLG
jgi:hypothetical protein